MSEQYTAIAPFYDRFNAVDYDAWCDFLEAKILQYGKQSQRGQKERELLDLACGTGAFSVRFCQRGYDVVGVDLSASMLALAREFAQQHGVAPLLLQQDMRTFELYGTVEVAICCLDSLNYLTTIVDWEKTFSLLHNYIEPNGLLIFDVHTESCLKRFAEQDFVCEDETGLLTWQSDFSQKTKTAHFYLSFFQEEQDGRYLRTNECQTQRAFSHATICRLLKKTGFSLLQSCSDFHNTPITDQDDRHFYICRCIKPNLSNQEENKA